MPEKNLSNADTARKFGIDLVGDIHWGTHLCQFYETKQDLIDILVPYFAEGLRSNEYCMWVTSPPLEVDEAKKALKKVVPNLEECIRKKQIEIISYNDWYLLGGKFDSNRVLQGWVEKEQGALKNGFDGLRLTGNTFWIERSLWQSFVDYEEAVNAVIGEHKMLALCTYCLSNCSGTDVLDVVRNHVGTLVKQNNKWYLVEDAARRKAVNGALKLSERKYSALFENMQDAFAYHKLLVDEAGRPLDYVFLEVNSDFERFTGLKRENVIGKRVTEILPDIQKDPANWIGVYGKVALTGEQTRFENYSQALGRWYQISAYSPQKGYFVATFEDITDRKENEESLRKINEELEERVRKRTIEVSSERQRLYNVLETLPAYVVLLDKDYCVPFANKVFRERFGESKGKPCYDFLFDRNSPCENCETYKVLKINGPHRWEWAGPDGRDYDIYDFPFVESDGSTLILEMGIDITQRKRAEKQLRDASLYARSLIEASLDPLVTISTEGKITDVNQATELATGCSRAELIGNDFSYYFTDPEKAKIGYTKVFTEGFVRDYPLVIKHKSGKTTEVLYNATIYTNEIGVMQGVFASARDITELKKAEAQAQEAAKKLKDSERLAAIGATAGMVGHDIRNPLQTISSELYFANKDLTKLPESQEKVSVVASLAEIEKSVDYINKVVQDLQDYSRPLNPKIEESDLKTIVNTLITKNGLPKNIKVSVEITDEATKVNADSYYLKRILYNLVINAVQAMPNGGKLTIDAYKDIDKTVLSVKDTGVGIPEEIQDKMFTLMFTTKSKGQGFGLPVVKRMTESLGGTVTFESQTGKGATFTVTLPVEQKTKP